MGSLNLTCRVLKGNTLSKYRKMWKLMTSPENILTVDVVENDNGSFTNTYTNSLCPELNTTETIKLGHTVNVNAPVRLERTITAIGDSGWEILSRMGGTSLDVKMLFTDWSLTIEGKVQGGGNWKQDFRKMKLYF